VKLKRNTSGELTDTIDVVLLGYYGGKGKRASLAQEPLAGVYDSDRDEFVTSASSAPAFPMRGGERFTSG